MKSISYSHKGRRATNQDLILEEHFAENCYLLAVIDGMGGYENGDIAARIIAESISTFISTVDKPDSFQIQKAINKSNLAIRQKKASLSSNMGATIGGIIIHDACAFCFWVGDVKIFQFRDKELVFESSSHSLVNELVERGSNVDPIKFSKYRHVVTRSIQGDVNTSQAEIEIIPDLLNSDIFLICSDGVHDLYDGIQIENILRSSSTTDEWLGRLKLRLLSEATDNFSLGIVSEIINQ